VGLVVAAVPFLSDWRLGVRGFDVDAAEQLTSMQEAFGAVYRRLADKADAAFPGVPMLATGHLTCLGSAGAPASPLRPGDALCVGGRLTVSPGTAPGAPHVVLEWSSDPVADMVADAALATLLALEGPPGGVLAAESAHEAARGSPAEEGARWRLFQAMLAAQFGPCALDEDAATLTLGDAAEAEARAEARAVVSLRTGEVLCDDQARRERIAKVFERIGNALLPLALPAQPED
jgi:hypothetical protein